MGATPGQGRGWPRPSEGRNGPTAKQGCSWPASEEELAEAQVRLAEQNERAPTWALPGQWPEKLVFGGCFIAYAKGEAGPGGPGDRAWGAAALWRLRTGPRQPNGSRLAAGGELVASSVLAGTVGARYRPGLLALREGPLLEAAVLALGQLPDVLLVDATGKDHPRRAGLAVHLGASFGVPSVGVTHRPLVAAGSLPALERGALSPMSANGTVVGYWVCTRSRARPVVAHAGWLTSAELAAEVVLACSNGRSRTPEPLREARRLAREARALAEGRAPPSEAY